MPAIAAANSAADPIQPLIALQAVELDPNNITISESLAKLRRNRKTKQYQERIIELAASIFEKGQTQPGQIRDTPEGLELIAGQRRLEAVMLLRSKAGQDLLGLDPEQAEQAGKCMFRAELLPDVTDDLARDLALTENIQRENFTAIELAYIIKELRQTGTPGEEDKTSQGIANYLGIEKTQVTQHERLLQLPAEIQSKCDLGEISMATALEYTNAKPGREAGVKERAEELAKQRADKNAEAIRKDNERLAKIEAQRKEAEETKKQAKVDKVKQLVKEKKLTKAEGDEKIALILNPPAKPVNPKPDAKHKPAGSTPEKRTPAATAAAQASAPATRVEQRDVRQAIKELDAAKVTKAPKMAEFRTLLEAWTGPVFPALVVKFAAGMLDWTEGKKTDKQATALLEDIADALPVGNGKSDPGNGKSDLVKKAEAAAPANKVPADKAPAKKAPSPAPVKKATPKTVVPKPAPKPAPKAAAKGKT